jgi:RTX calcium-binding nonapeptide repeat (4 copies)
MANGKGTKKADKWKGTLGNDIFSAGAGNDICTAGGGNDKVDCGAGNDRADGGNGNDIIDGGRGGDTIVGGAGTDRLLGGAGDDDISGGAGNDIIFGGAGNDTLNGDSGKDKLFGQAGDDNVSGGSGNDFLDGGDGDDFLIGGTGDDRVIGGLGNDTLDWDDGEGNDIMSGNEGRDTIEVNGSLDRGDNFVLGKNPTGNAFFERIGLDGKPEGQFNLVVDTSEVFDVIGEGGNDTFVVNDLTGTGVELVKFNGGAGDDTLDASASSTQIEALGGEGNDTLDGGSANDSLDGGAGNDIVAGRKGDDRMIGGLGDDTLEWDDGEGNDVISGNEGRDIVDVDGSLDRGDNFVLGKNPAGKAFFERIGLDGKPEGQFNLVVDTSEVFDVSGEGGNDTFVVKDLTGTGVELVKFDGGAGDDTLDASASSTPIEAIGGEGNDILIGGTGKIVVSPTSTLGDTLTGGAGQDKFEFLVDPFSGGTPGQNLNQPDVVTDFEFSTDQFVFSKQQFGINEFNFQKGQVGNLQDGNLLILEGQFANAGEAAKAIAANNNIQADKGIFVYYNSTLGISRAVFSQDLGDAGPFSVQANITNLTSSALQANFKAADFALA